MKKSSYIIMAPPYRDNSGGVRILHELRRHLEERGYPATISQGCNAPYNAIVIYPEVVSGNPMSGNTVVRYVLYYPGVLGGEKQYDTKEIIFTFLPAFYPEAPFLTVPIVEDFFRDEGLPRSGKYVWTHKGKNIPRIPETDGLTDISDWNIDRKAMAGFLNKIEVLYSYDSCTVVHNEARRCGCKVIVIPDEITGYEESVKDFDIQLDEFIRITQEAAE